LRHGNSKEPLSPQEKEALRRLGQRIKSRRGELGLTQEDLADEAGLHRTYISLLEVGKRNPSILTLRKIALALGVRISDLLEDIA